MVFSFPQTTGVAAPSAHRHALHGASRLKPKAARATGGAEATTTARGARAGSRAEVSGGVAVSPNSGSEAKGFEMVGIQEEVNWAFLLGLKVERDLMNFGPRSKRWLGAHGLGVSTRMRFGLQLRAGFASLRRVGSVL